MTDTPIDELLRLAVMPAANGAEFDYRVANAAINAIPAIREMRKENVRMKAAMDFYRDGVPFAEGPEASLTASLAREAAMRKALEPFAHAAFSILLDDKADDDLIGPAGHIRVGELRAARLALSTKDRT